MIRWDEGLIVIAFFEKPVVSLGCDQVIDHIHGGGKKDLLAGLGGRIGRQALFTITDLKGFFYPKQRPILIEIFPCKLRAYCKCQTAASSPVTCRTPKGSC
jgi:hypothetical protein